MIHRHDNYIWPQLADDRLAAGMIADGHHLPPRRCEDFLSAQRPLPERSSSATCRAWPACRRRKYPSELCELEILPNGKLVVAGQSEILAGASLPLGTCIANTIRFADITLGEAIAMAVDNPAMLLGTDIPRPFLQPGSPVELALFDLIESTKEPPALHIRPEGNTHLGNDVVFGKIPTPA